ncbi:bile acid:sodium symporter family protein, partial [Staphylococcus warneri]
ITKKVAEKTVAILPNVSVIAISLILASVVGGSKEQILKTGLLIFLVVIVHNVLGYTIGFILARVFKLERRDQKAVSIEVGMQN